MSYDECYFGESREDKVIREMCQVPDKGVFVDVGAGHPEVGSNTLHFEKNGWTGLCVDADEDRVNLLRKMRSCHVELAAVGMKEGEVLVYKNVWGNYAIDTPPNEDKRTVPTVRLEALLEKYSIGKIDLLSIDVDGLDLDVWRSMDWEKHKPTTVIIERSLPQQKELLEEVLKLPYEKLSIEGTVSNNEILVLKEEGK